MMCLCMFLTVNHTIAISINGTIREAKLEKDTLSYIAEIWKQDSVGCLNLRTKYVKYLMSHFPIEKYNLYEVLVLLGKPNLIYVNQAKFINNSGELLSDSCIYVVYYYNTECDEGKFNYQILDRPMIKLIFSSKGEGLMVR